MTVTEKYKLSSGQYMGVIISIYQKRWWWAFLLPIITQLFLAAESLVFIYTAVITIFLIYSLIFTFLYYIHATTLEARIAILEKYLKLNDKGIDIIFSEIDDEHPTPTPIFITWEDISSLKYTKKYFIIFLKGSNYRIIPLPYTASSDNTHLHIISTTLQSHITKH